MTDNLPPLPQTDWLLHMPAQGLPDGWVPVPVELLKRAESSLGSFCSDHGWGSADMDTMDAISAVLAASPAQLVQPINSQSMPDGWVAVPKQMTQEMRDATDAEGWTWEDLLAAAQAITEAEYEEVAASPAQPKD